MAKFAKAGKASEALGVSQTQLRRMAISRQLPNDAVIATPGGHFFYDVESVRGWMAKNFRRQVRLPA